MWETFKKFLESKGITDEKFQAMGVEEVAKLHAEWAEAIRKNVMDTLQNAPTAQQVKDINQALKDLEAANKELTEKTVADLQQTIKDLGLEVTTIKEGRGPGNLDAGFRANLKAALEAKAEALKELKNDMNGSERIEVKAAVSMTFATNTTGQVGREERMPGIVRDLQRTPTLLDLVDVSPSNANNFTWIEKTGRDGGVAMVAEGAVKPQGDFDLEEHSQKPKKMALIITVSKEMLDDIDGLMAEIESEIEEQIRLFADDAILTGDGTGNNIEGLDANATAFAAGTFAGTVDNANIFDAIRVAINQVELNYDFPTAILMHPSDATSMELVKDPTTSQYVLPPFISAGGTLVKGLPVRTSTVVTQGEAYVGNFKRFKVKMREDLTLDVGYRGIQGDWEKNMISFLGEQRLFAFIPENHYGSIVKLDLDVAIAALETA